MNLISPLSQRRGAHLFGSHQQLLRCAGPLFVSHGYALSVLNPAILVSYRKSEQVHSKTDKLDDELLARYAHAKQPRL